jgi:glycosyltransferase involved in cell wall biosynthesis
MLAAGPPPELSASTVVVAGVIRDGESQLSATIRRLRSALETSAQLHWVVIESDSSDQTGLILNDLSKSIPNFRFECLGDLRHSIQERTERLAVCRNRYLEIIAEDPVLDEADYVVVADLDGINNLVDASAIASCWSRTDWDVCFANQAGPYYDIWTLRHPEWCPGNSRSELQFLNRHRRTSYRNLDASVYSRMIQIEPDSAWIQVTSAFGGLAVYRRSSLRGRNYSHLDDSQHVCCEHVPLNLSLSQAGGRLLINPALINSGWNEHSRQTKLRIRLARRAKLTLLDWVFKWLGEARHDWLLKQSTRVRSVVPSRLLGNKRLLPRRPQPSSDD